MKKHKITQVSTRLKILEEWERFKVLYKKAFSSDIYDENK
jgi:hypothetical protein